MRKNIEELIASGFTAYRVSKETGIPNNTVVRIFSGEAKIDNITLKNAEILSAYWEDVKMNKLTVSNVESTFDKVCEKIGDELQGTSTYLMRADSIIEAAEELELPVTEFLERIDKSDYDKVIDYAGPIVWADYDKQDFYILINNDEESIQEFCAKVLAK